MDEEIKEKIASYIDKKQEDLFAELSRLIQFDTTNKVTYGQEEKCQQYVYNNFKKLGYNVDFYCLTEVDGLKEHKDFLSNRGAEDRKNVCATIPGQNQKKIMVSAHADTMPVGDIKEWTVDPFAGVVKDGRVYGLGANDNKYGIAAMLFIAKMFKELNIKPFFTYDFLSYTDEEYGGGNGALAASLKERYKTTISLDSGNYEIWRAAIGGGGFFINLKTVEPTDSSAMILDALTIVKHELDLFAAQRHEELYHNKLYVGSDMERSAFRYLDFKVGEGATGLNKGTLRFIFYTSMNKEQSFKELQSYIGKVRKKLKDKIIVSDAIPSTRFFHYLENSSESTSVKHMKKCAEQFVDYEVKEKGACMSDLSLFMKYASEDSFGFGALRDFALYGGAHQVDEFVDCREFLNVTKSIALFMATYTGQES